MRVSGGRGEALRAVLVVGAASLMVVVVAWASLIGPDEVFTGPGPQPSTVTTTTETCEPSLIPGSSDDACQPPDTSRRDAEDIVRQADPPVWLKLVVWALELAILAGFAAFVVFLLTVAVRAARRRRARAYVREEVGFVTLDEPGRIAEAIADDAEEQQALLTDGEPRNAIVAAWHRFEAQGERAGVDRAPWETSSELVLRMLERVGADSGAVNRLAGLYREARFSDHPITEEHRAEALRALEDVRRSLGVRS